MNMLKYRRFSIASIGAVFCATSLMAGELSVSADRGDGQYTTIQSAINAANNGDRIKVYPGTYLENIDFLGKRILIFSAEGAKKTNIDGQFRGPTVTFSSGENRSSELRGFTICHGSGRWAAADGDSGYAGGGLFISGAHPQIIDCDIRDNYAEFGGGAGVGFDAKPLFEGCTFRDNYTYSNGLGGGVYAIYSKPEFVDTVFKGNYSALDGGGMYTNQCDVEVDGCKFLKNTAEQDGGAIDFYLSSANVLDTRFKKNQAASAGGAMALDESDGFVKKCTLLKNSAGAAGGVGVLEGSLKIIDSRVSKNEANGYYVYIPEFSNFAGGIGIYKSSFDLDSVTIDRNRADQCGGVGIYDSVGIIDNCEVKDNKKTGIHVLDNNSRVDLRDTKACQNNGQDVKGPFDNLGGNNICDR